MNHHIQDFVDRVLSISPIPSEAYPGGLVGKIPATKPLIEAAWQGMEILMFSVGTIFGIVVTLVFFLAIAFRASIPSILKAVANASH